MPNGDETIRGKCADRSGVRGRRAVRTVVSALIVALLGASAPAQASSGANRPIALSILSAPLTADLHSNCVRSQRGVTGAKAVTWDLLLTGNWRPGDRFRIRISDDDNKVLKSVIIGLDYSSGSRVCRTHVADRQGWIEFTYNGPNRNFSMPIIGYGTSRDLFPGKRTVAEAQRLSNSGAPGYYAVPIPIPPIEGQERRVLSWQCFAAASSGFVAWASKNALRALSYIPGLGGASAGVVSAFVDGWAPLPVPDGSTVQVPTWVVTLQNAHKLREFDRELNRLEAQGRVVRIQSAPSGNRIRFRLANAESAVNAAVDSVQALAEAGGVYAGAKFACGG